MDNQISFLRSFTKIFLPKERSGVHNLLLLILFFLLPFSHKTSNILLTLLLFLSIVEVFRTKSFSKIKLYWFLPSLFLYYILSEALTGGTWPSIEKRFLFLAIPLLFALNSQFNKKNLRSRLYLSYIIGNLTVVLFCLFRATSRSFVIKNGTLVFNPKIIQDTNFDFLTSSIMGGNFFFGHDYSYFLDPIYFGLYIVFAQYLIFEVGRKPSSIKMKAWLVASYLVMWLALFLLSSKAAMISSLLLTFYIVLYIFFKLNAPLYIRLGTIGGIVVAGSIFIFLNPRLKLFKDTVSITQFTNPDPNARFGHDLRILSWTASIELIRENWLLGAGEGRKRSALVEVYDTMGYEVPKEEQHNSHNQYLDFLIGGGLIGLGIFMTGLIQLFIKGVKERNSPLIAFLLLFCFTALIENLLSRHWGILFFTIFISLLMHTDEPHLEFRKKR